MRALRRFLTLRYLSALVATKISTVYLVDGGEGPESAEKRLEPRRMPVQPGGRTTAGGVRPNELTRRRGLRGPRELLAQFTHPLALLLMVAAALAWLAATPVLTVAIIIVLNGVSRSFRNCRPSVRLPR